MEDMGLATDLKRTPQFKILRARRNMEFKAARAKLEQTDVAPGWREQLESEYAEFMDTVKQWQQLQTSGAIAMHLSAEIPGLEMELWAIRRQ